MRWFRSTGYALLSTLSCGAIALSAVIGGISDLEAQPIADKANLVATVNSDSRRAAAPMEHLSFEAELPSPSKMKGFHMESAPEIDLVFGDISFFKNHLDRYDQLSAQMRIERRSFGRATQIAQRRLMLERKVCKDPLLARSYTEANDSGLRFRQLGAKAESLHRAIRQLDSLGETSGLTPNYRRKVKQSRQSYRQSLSDLEEMRAVFSKQLGKELRARGCDPAALLAFADTLPAPEQALDAKTLDRTIVMPAHKERKWRKDLPTPHRAATKTFFVDNRSCSSAARVFVDGVLLGEAKAGERVAFQASSGRHELCLIDAESKAECGEAGTRRRAFLYDGFRMTRHCSKQK